MIRTSIIAGPRHASYHSIDLKVSQLLQQNIVKTKS